MKDKKTKPTSERAIVQERISAFEPATLILGIILSAFSAIICMQIIGKIGTTPNTSLIGAILAMVVGRIPAAFFSKYRSIERQNLIQTTVSAGGFAAANCGMLTVSIFFIMGKTSYIWPMLIGSLFAVVVSIIIVGKLFDSRIFPAESTWPPGVATASAIEAGDEGGSKGKRLLQGIVVGGLCSHLKLPAAAVGIAFLSNIFSISALGAGLVIRGYSETFFGLNLGDTYIPHGMMIGAGLVALIQSAAIVLKGSKGQKTSSVNFTVSDKDTQRTIRRGFLVYMVGALLLAIISGIITELNPGKMILWLIWSAFSSIVSMLLVGMSAMHSGWFPAFAITTIFMTIGIFLGFPPIALALLTGYVSSVGPCFADMGFDLKAGWILRGKGQDVEYELYGRKQQIYVELIGGIVGIVVVALTMNIFFEADLIPPISKVFATTVGASADDSLIRTLLIWAVPGALIQFIGGASNMVGVLFGTGLLINNPKYGLGILIAVVARIILGKEIMDMRSSGLIVGDGLYGFFSALIRALI